MSSQIKKKILKSEIARKLYCLNFHTYELRERYRLSESDEEKSELYHIIKELYILKNEVLVKLILEGNAKICYIQGKQFYLVKIMKNFTFHLPMTGKIKRMINERFSTAESENRPEGQTV